MFSPLPAIEPEANILQSPCSPARLNTGNEAKYILCSRDSSHKWPAAALALMYYKQVSQCRFDDICTTAGHGNSPLKTHPKLIFSNPKSAFTNVWRLWVLGWALYCRLFWVRPSLFLEWVSLFLLLFFLFNLFFIWVSANTLVPISRQLSFEECRGEKFS